MLHTNQMPVGKLGILLVLVCFLIVGITPGNSGINNPIEPTKAEGVRADPVLTGPENLCLVFGSAVGIFSAGGDPVTDVYSWVITDSNGEPLLERSGGGSNFESISVPFTLSGTYTVSLSIRRNNTVDFYTNSLSVTVQQGPEITLLTDYLLCGSEPAELTAIDPNSLNFDRYSFIWRDAEGNELGNSNVLTVATAGFYNVDIFLSTSGGGQDCLISGTTYVGPSIDFQLLQLSEEICDGQTIEFGTDIPLAGEWFIRKTSESERTSLGTSYQIVVDTDLLTGPGTYEVIFSAIDQQNPDCRSERKTSFTVKGAPSVELTILERPDDCLSTNGSFSITTTSPLDSLLIPEAGFTRASVAAGETFTFDNLSPQILRVQSFLNGCLTTDLAIVEAKDPPVTSPPPSQVTVVYTTESESCSATGRNPGFAIIEFPDGNVEGEYRVLSTRRGLVTSGLIQDQDSLYLELPAGTYQIEVTIEGCVYPIQSVTIEANPQVLFSIPETFNFCETFDLIPETSEDLVFTLTFPDGTQETKPAQESFTLTQGGDYTLLGIAADPSSEICPMRSFFTANLSERISFDAEIVEEDCFGNKLYQAIIQGANPEETSIRWINSEGQIVGRGAQFYPTTVGEFSLIVQPRGSGICPDASPVNFTVTTPVLEVPVVLEASVLCPEPAKATITLTTDEEEVERIQWIFYDVNDNRSDLTEYEDSLEIQVSLPGTYEAVVYNVAGCELGRSLIEVEETSLLELPNIIESYPICSRGNAVLPIDPGEYETYSWYLGEQLVSRERLYKPTEVGEFTLAVTSVDGCEFIETFRTYDACNFDYVYPNSMVLGDPERDFRVLASEGVTDAEIFITNRQGALIHHQRTSEIPVASPFLNWDGRSNGSYVPIGTYAVIIILRNTEFGFEEKLTISLLVIQ